MPAISRHLSTPTASQLMFTPKASKISAPPHLLVILLFPCFAITTPHEAAIIAETVLTLKVLNLSPPVPQLSTRGLFSSGDISNTHTTHGLYKAGDFFNRFSFSP